MNDQEVNSLVLAICRCSLVQADNAGLSITAEQLKHVYERVGAFFVFDRIVKPHKPTVGDVMKKYDWPSEPK